MSIVWSKNIRFCLASRDAHFALPMINGLVSRLAGNRTLTRAAASDPPGRPYLHETL